MMNLRCSNHLKRVLALILCILMVIVLLPGCGDSGKGSGTVPEQDDSQGQEEGQEPEDSPEPEDGPDEQRVADLMSGMTLEEKIGQMMIPSFRVWNGEDVTELNDEIRQCLEKNHFGGTILFAENFLNAEQTYRLTRDLQAANQKGSSIPLFISADQEGGYVTRIGYGTDGIGNMALAATGDENAAREMAAIHGNELKALGLNMDFAPVVDVNSNPSNPVIGNRSFSDDPETTARFAAAFMEGLNGAGIISTLKHFPGHGDTDVDSHTGFPVINKTYDELKAFELIPFRAAAENGAEMIMTAHIQYPKIESETYISVSTGEEVYLPATMSKTILTDILRQDMGFEGVIVTDALDMGAISDNFAFDYVLAKTINAGADMLILPLITNQENFERTDGVVGLTASLVKEGKIPEERIDDAVRRILLLKEKRGILDESDFAVTDEGIANAERLVGSEENRAKEWELAEKALTIVKNENGAFPLADPDGETLILFADSCASRAGYGELARSMLSGKNIKVMVNTSGTNSECLNAAANAENVILISREYDPACLDPATEDGFSTETFDDIIAQRHADGKTVIVISCHLPYDAARFPEADAMILAYCSSYLPKAPAESGEGSAYSPNLEAAILACFNGGELNGKLPVNIPKLGPDYKPTAEMLYTRAN